jgi:hypothetical protein
MQAQQAHVARSRTIEERSPAQRTLVQPPPHKERALWNFLTWSFFIAQVLAAEQFIGAQAKAAGSLDLSSPDASAAQAMPKSDLASLESAAGTSDDVRQSLGGSLDDLSFQSLKLGQFGGTVVDLDSISVARVEDVSQSISVAGYATDAGLAPTGDTPGDLLPAPLVDVDLPDILGVIGDTTGPLLDTVEDIVATLTGVVGGITDPLLDTVGDVVQIADDVLEPVTDVAAALTDPLNDVVHDVLSPVTDVVATLTDPLGDVVHDILNPVTDVVATLTDPLGDVVHDVLNPVTDVVATLTDPLGDVVHDILNPVTDVVATLTDPLGDVIHDVLNPVTDVVADLTEPLDNVAHDVLNPVTALLATGDDPVDTAQDILASGGDLALPIVNLAGLDDLFDNGRYTDYSIELQVNGPLPDMANVTDAVADAATDTVDHTVNVVTSPLDDVSGHVAHLLDDVNSGGLLGRLL